MKASGRMTHRSRVCSESQQVKSSRQKTALGQFATESRARSKPDSDGLRTARHTVCAGLLFAVQLWNKALYVCSSSHMMTAEDCHRMAAQWLGKANLASDSNTSASMRRASDAWAALAQRIEQSALTRIQSHVPVRRPADLAKPRSTTPLASVQIADALRELLHLCDPPSEES